MRRFFQGIFIAAAVLFLTMGSSSLWAGAPDSTQPFKESPTLMAAAADRKPTAGNAKAVTRPALKPDLVVSAIRLTSDCQIQVTLKNKGPGGTPEAAYHRTSGAIVQATANGAGWGGYRLFMVDPNKKLKKPGASVRYVGFKRTLKPGETLSLKMEIKDPNNTVAEINETNNSLTKRLTCSPKTGPVARETSPMVRTETGPVLRLKPDLTIKTMKIEPANPTTLDTIRFSAFVHNAGAVPAQASKAGIRIGGETYPVVFAKPPITAGSSNAIVRQLKIERADTYWVKFIADVDDDVSESNENNNMGSLKFSVVEPAPPDLTVTNITNNSTNCLVYTLKNVGGPIPSSVDRSSIGIRFTKAGIVGYSISNLALVDPNCELCKHNGFVTATKCNPSSTTGQWYDCIQAKVEVDYTDKLAESDETNNSMEDNALDCGGPPTN